MLQISGVFFNNICLVISENNFFWPLSAKQNSGENSRMQVTINWNFGFYIYGENVIFLYVFDVYEISMNFPQTIFIPE